MRRSLSWGELAAAVGVVAAVCGAYLSLAWYGFDLLEEGYFLTNARRVQLGGLPYRDFDAPYTPGIFYLYAWLLDWLGSSMVALRTPAVIGRGVTFLLLYVLGRRVMPPFFAALAPLLIVCIDLAPPYWSIHPGWIATPATLMAALAVVRYLDRGRARWLFAAGVATGVAFAFKQNLAVFVLMAALWLLVVAERRLPPVTTRHAPPHWAVSFMREAVRGAALWLLPLSALSLVRPYLSPLVATLFVVPLALLSLVGAWRGHGVDTTTASGRELSFYARPLLMLAGFAAVTVPWLLVLATALDGQWGLLRGFVGQVDPAGYFYGMVPPQWDDWRLVGTVLAIPAALGVLWASVGWLLTRPRRVRAVAALAVVCAAASVSAAVPGWTMPSLQELVAETYQSLVEAWRGYRETWPHTTDDLVLYLPPLAFWVGLVPVAATAHRQRDTVRLWYLVAGACLLLTQYPRMDYGHIVWSGGLLYLVGAERLHALYRALVGLMPSSHRLGGFALVPLAQRVTVALSLTLLPAVASLPYALQRADWLSAVLAAPREDSTARAGQHLVPLELPLGKAHVWAVADEARPILGVVELLRIHSEPGEPIFVYPAIPGIYYLADRPNATRFNHLFAGMASPEDQEEMVRQLERVRWVVWDDGTVYTWVKPEDNAPVMEYLRRHFRTAQTFGQYVVLSRDGDGPPRPKKL